MRGFIILVLIGVLGYYGYDFWAGEAHGAGPNDLPGVKKDDGARSDEEGSGRPDDGPKRAPRRDESSGPKQAPAAHGAGSERFATLVDQGQLDAAVKALGGQNRFLAQGWATKSLSAFLTKTASLKGETQLLLLSGLRSPGSRLLRYLQWENW